MIVGVLALQGAVREHMASLNHCGVDTRIVKRKSDLEGLSGLILPGGESTAMSLLAEDGFTERMKALADKGFPMFGTCAGMILLSEAVEGRPTGHIRAIDITVARNASGRQVDSFETVLDVEGIGPDIPAVFIRAPYIVTYGEGVKPMAVHDGSVVMARQDNILVASFHPELTDDRRIHEYFIEMVKETGT